MTESKEESILQSSLLSFWERLASIQLMALEAESKSEKETGWNGKGNGEVSVKKEDDSSLILTEKGAWINQQGHEIEFSNRLRWTLDLSKERISLEHLHLGMKHPVFLFYLVPTGKNSLTSVLPHTCSKDTYQASLSWDSDNIKMTWQVIGPKKNEKIEYFYY